MTRTWFTADTHFGHVGVLRFSERPFADVKEMDRSLIEMWNAVVRPDDEVWHLGDFAHRAADEHIAGVFHRLNGGKNLIIGNHDAEATLALPWASPPERMREIAVEGQRIFLCHYAMRDWPYKRRGAISLFGHQHGRLPGTSLSCDVGVDCWNFMPVSLDQIRLQLAENPEDEPAPQGTSI